MDRRCRAWCALCQIPGESGFQIRFQIEHFVLLFSRLTISMASARSARSGHAARASAFSGTASRTLSKTSSGSIPSAWASKFKKHAMAQTGQINPPQVFKTHVESPVQERADLGRQHQRLHAARTAAPANVLVGHVGGERPVRVRAQRQPDRIVLNVRGDDHLADQTLEPQQRLAVQHLFGLGTLAAGGAVENRATALRASSNRRPA